MKKFGFKYISFNIFRYYNSADWIVDEDSHDEALDGFEDEETDETDEDEEDLDEEDDIFKVPKVPKSKRGRKKSFLFVSSSFIQLCCPFSFYRSQNVLCRSKFFESAQKFDCIFLPAQKPILLNANHLFFLSQNVCDWHNL